MTRPLSNDLRERVVAAVAAGESCESGDRLSVAVGCVGSFTEALAGFASRRATHNRAAKAPLEIPHEFLRRERTARGLGPAQHGEAGFVPIILVKQRPEIANPLKQRLDDDEPVVPSGKMGTDA